jgi:serine/threonine protein kinase
MATVFLAEHPRISKRVAVKVIHQDLASSPEMVSRFLAEARAASQINHEHVVDILDFGQTETGENFMIMEYLEGQTLSARVKAASRLDGAVTQNVGAQIADALIVAHGRGVIHRDLKPDNIFLVRRPTNPDYVKILDFGLAKLLTGSEGLQHRTSSGSVLGTPHYMAPEQCEGRVTVDGRADLYSLGCILFHMVTGDLPFPGEGFAEVILKHLGEAPPNPRSLNPQVSPSWNKLILHCLAKNRDYRFQSADELLEALKDPERWSMGFGDDPMKILGPMPGFKPKRLPQLEPPAPTTVIGQGVPVPTALESNHNTVDLASLAGGTNMAPPKPMPIGRPASGAPSPAVTVISVPTSNPQALPASQSPLLPSRAPTSNPPPMDIPVGPAARSQLAETPVVANRAAPQMATMIGEMPAAAISALAALAPPPSNAAVASNSNLRPVPASQPHLPAMSPPGQMMQSPGQMNSSPGQMMQPSGQMAPSSSQPQQLAPPKGQSPMMASSQVPLSQVQATQPLPPSAATPPSASASGRGGPSLMARLGSTGLGRAFLALPQPRRLLILRASAGGFAGLVLVLLVVLLWPRKTPIIVRSDPDQAEVLRDGESLGTTPVVVELKKGAAAKLTLRKEGYEDAVQEIEGGGEKVVLVTLEEKGSGGSKPASPKKATPSGGNDTTDEGEGDEGTDDGKGETGSDGVKKKRKKKKSGTKKAIIF